MYWGCSPAIITYGQKYGCGRSAEWCPCLKNMTYNCMIWLQENFDHHNQIPKIQDDTETAIFGAHNWGPISRTNKNLKTKHILWESIQSFPLRNLRYQKREFQSRRPNYVAKRHAINQDGSLALKLQYKVIVVIRHFLSLHFFLQQLLGHPKGHSEEECGPPSNMWYQFNLPSHQPHLWSR